MEAKGSRRQGWGSDVRLTEGGRRQRRGLTNRYGPETRKSSGQVDQAGLGETSRQHTTKSSIHREFQSRISDNRASKVAGSTPGGLLCALGSRVRRKLAEGRAIGPDRIGEVSRWHTRRGSSLWSMCRGNWKRVARNAEVSPRQRPERCPAEWFG